MRKLKTHINLFHDLLLFLVFHVPRLRSRLPRYHSSRSTLGKTGDRTFGTLFEGHATRMIDLAFGAGFTRLFINSYYRGERNKLQFFVRPSD